VIFWGYVYKRERGKEEVTVERISVCQAVVYACCQFACMREKETMCMRLCAYLYVEEDIIADGHWQH